MLFVKGNKDKTSKKIWKKIIFSFLACLLWGGFVHSLSFEEFYDDYFGSFDSFIDENEGLTSFRSLNVPFGGRAESLGGAFTALANDISFFEYNPAASSILKNTELAVFHNSWIADTSIDTIAFTIRNNTFGFGTFAKCLYLPFTEYNIFGQKMTSGYYSESVLGLNFSNNFFAGYNFRGLALGATIKVAYRSMPDYSDDYSGNIIEDSGLSQSAFALLGDFGLRTSFNFGKFFISREPNFHIGLSLMNLGLAFENEGLDLALPTKINAGMAWTFAKTATINLEVQKPLNLSNISKSEKMAFGGGFSFAFTKSFAFQTGFLLKGGNPKISLGAEFPVKILLLNINYTFDLSSSLSPINRFSLSAKLNLGDRGRQDTQAKIDELYVKGLQLYAEGYIAEAIDAWEEILVYNKNFDPAIYALETAKETLALQIKIREIQTLD